MTLLNVTLGTLSAPAMKKRLSYGIATLEVCAIEEDWSTKPLLPIN